MKRISLLLTTLSFCGILMAQSGQKIVPRTSLLEQQQQLVRPEAQPVPMARPTQGGSVDPIGTVHSDMITTVKMGEASNSFSTLASECNPLSVVPGVGTNGGSLAFVYRRNINNCGGTAIDNGRVTYSISTDFGASWNVGGGVTATASTPPPVNHCFGVLELTPQYDIPARYPMGVLFSKSGGVSLADLVLTSSSALINNGQWDGNHIGTITDPAGTATLQQDDYSFQGVGHTISGGMVERVPGEFWFVTNETQGGGNLSGPGRIFVYKGTFNQTTQKTDWVQAAVITPNNFLLDGTNATVLTPNMAFSPDGTVGYISWLGDLAGGQDSVLSPIVVESTDGGQTWGTPYEISMPDFPEIGDSLRSILVLDSIGPGQFDTIPFATGKATTGFDHDLVVDANGNPHLLTTIGATETVTATNSGYTIFGGIFLMNVAFTKDQFGDWNAVYVSTQNTFRGWFGDLSTSGPQISQDVHTQVARSADGTKIFYLWTDTDTVANGWSPLPSFPTGNNMTNHSPDLRMRVYDITTNLLTPMEIVTANDANWGGRVLLPKVSPIAVDMGNGMYNVPTVITNIDAGSSLSTTSFHYITDVTVDISLASQTPIYFYNCKENPFANNISEVQPGCGASNGELSLNAAGGVAPYDILWSNNATTTSITGLSAGIYNVTITDDKGCTDEISYTLNNANAPAVSIDQVSVADISCFGANDGAATVTVSGGAGSETYTWSNGETAAAATGLMPGLNTVEVTDANGCTSFASVMISEPDMLEVSLSMESVDCFGNANGSATAVAVGGTGTLSYSWDNAMTGATISNLSGGIYTVTITDVNGCTTTGQIVVDEPSELTINSSTSPNTGSATSPNGTASASGSGGNSPYIFDWVGPLESATPNTINNAPFIFGLCDGSYEVTVTDGTGCVTVDTVIVTAIGDGCDVADGIADELAAGITVFQLFPNPAQNQVQLRLAMDRPESVNVQITNLHGQLMQQFTAASTQQFDQTIDLKTLAAGMYFVQVETSRGRATQRLIVE